MYKKYINDLENKLANFKDMALEIKDYLINEVIIKDNEDPDYNLILTVLLKIESSSLDNLSSELTCSLDCLNNIGVATLRLISKNSNGQINN